MKKLTKIIGAVAMLLLLLPSVFAGEDDDWKLFGIEGEKLFNLLSGILSTALFALTSAAYSRTKNKRLLYVASAFLLFAVKGFMISAELFFGEWGGWVDPVAAVLDFAILAGFFLGIIKK